MKKLLAYTVFFAAEILFSNAFAQTGDSVKPWSISDCFNYAGEHNLQVSTLRLNEQSSRQDLRAAKGLKLPSLSGSAGNIFTNANNSNGRDGLVNQLTSSGSYSVSSSIVLWNDHYISNNIRLQELQLQSAGLSVQQSLNNITLLITQYYLDILLAKENLKYITDLVSTSEARVRQGQMLYDAGSLARKDLLQLQAQLAGDRYLLVQAQNAIRQNILALKQALQLPAGDLFDVITPDTVIVAPSLAPLYEARQAALRDFPEIKIGRLGVDMASLNILLAKAGSRPTLSANGSLGTGYSDVITNSVFSKTGYFTQAGNNFYQRAGVTLSIPIFSNYINKANLAKARIAHKKAELGLQNDQLALSQAVEQAYLDAGNAMQLYQAAIVQLRSATESYRISNEQFRLKAISIYDLLQQRNQYLQAVQAFTQAKYTAVLQQKIYEFYMGRPVTL